MEMDSTEEFTGSSDRMMIVKGRRSKRPRQSSPGGDGGGGGSELISFIPSISISDISSSNEEDEDMANCLILLAQSGCERQRQVDVYECKTCNRSFQSFQALGGHRASHKWPKQNMVEDKKTPILSSSSSSHDHQVKEEPQEEKLMINNKFISHPLSIKRTFNKSEIHECLICGLEYSSGQALGGHMRRHRTTPISNKVSIERERPQRIVQLDLNLPAPEDDHDNSSLLRFSTNQTHLFSSPAVDCNY